MLSLFLSLVPAGAWPAAAGAPAATGVAAGGDPAFLSGAKRVVMLIVDRLAVDDLTRDPRAAPALRALGERGGVALLNVRTDAQANSRNGYLTIGAGVRAQAGDWAGLAFHADERFRGEPAGDVYQSLTGEPAGAPIVHLGIGEARRIAAESYRAPVPGALGESLREAGLRVSVFGNGDVQGEERRYAALIAMDAAGRVQAGNVGGGATLRDPAWPGLYRTDYERLLALALRAVESDDLVVVDLADLARLEELRDYIGPDRFARFRHEAIERIDAFAGALAEALERRDERVAVIVASPSPQQSAASQGVLLTPVIFASAGGGGAQDGYRSQAGDFRSPDSAPGSRAGLLMSASTKRPGLVMNIDLAPAIARILGAGGKGRFDGGAIVTAGEVERPWEWIAREYERIAAVHVQRLSVIQPFFFAQMGIIVAGALLVWASARGAVRWSPRCGRAWRLLLLAAFSFPLALLLLSPLPPAPLWAVWARIALAVAAIAGLASRFARDDAAAAGILAGATAVALLADVALGEPLMADSLLGYSPISGSRFYGIGNEYMGILIGCALILAGATLDAGRRVKASEGSEESGASGTGSAPRVAALPTAAPKAIAAVVLLFLIVTAFLALPQLGVNAGGTITAIVGFSYFLIALSGRRFTVAGALLVGLLVVAVLGGVSLIDSRLSDGSSHFGQTMQKVGEQGADPLWSAVERKVSVNLRLIRLTIWSRVVLLSFGLLALLVFCPGRLMNELKRRHPFMSLSLKAALVAALTTLAVNDSGIVAAATLLLPATLVTLLLLPPAASVLAREGGRRDAVHAAGNAGEPT